MGNSSGDLREFLRNAEALKRQTVQKQQKNLTEEPEEYRDARRKAMRLLEHMDRTEKGLREKLRQAGFTSQAVDHALTYVEAYGYIDDERYARTYIAYKEPAEDHPGTYGKGNRQENSDKCMGGRGCLKYA